MGFLDRINRDVQQKQMEERKQIGMLQLDGNIQGSPGKGNMNSYRRGSKGQIMPYEGNNFESNKERTDAPAKGSHIAEDFLMDELEDMLHEPTGKKPMVRNAGIRTES